MEEESSSSASTAFPPARQGVTADARSAKELVGSIVAARMAQAEDGRIREELLATISEQLQRAWPEEPTADQLASVGATDTDELTDALVRYHRRRSGLRARFAASGSRIRTLLFDAWQGVRYLVTGRSSHEGRYRDGTWSNWTRTYRTSPANFVSPQTGEELQKVVAAATRLRVVGSGHSFNDSTLSRDTLVSLDDCEPHLEIDATRRRAWVGGGVRLRDLTKALAAHNLALPVLGSTDAQSIAGLVSTDLHGTGRDHAFLSQQLLALDVVAHDGTIQRVGPRDALFHAAIGGIGTCGIIAQLELQLVDHYNVEKTTQLVDRADAEDGIEVLLAANRHVSFYYIGGARVGRTVRLHRWNRTDAPVTPGWSRRKRKGELADFALSAFVPGFAGLAVDRAPDHWLARALAPPETLVLPAEHAFSRTLFYAHDEIEYGVPFEHYRACLAELMEMLRIHRFFSIVEVRFSPDRSQALLGPGVGRRTAYIELATPLAQRQHEIFALAEQIFRRYRGQPHLGKKCGLTTSALRALFGPRFDAFDVVRRRQDPTGKFLNGFTRRLFCDGADPT